MEIRFQKHAVWPGYKITNVQIAHINGTCVLQIFVEKACHKTLRKWTTAVQLRPSPSQRFVCRINFVEKRIDHSYVDQSLAEVNLTPCCLLSLQNSGDNIKRTNGGDEAHVDSGWFEMVSQSESSPVVWWKSFLERHVGPWVLVFRFGRIWMLPNRNVRQGCLCWFSFVMWGIEQSYLDISWNSVFIYSV